MEDRPPVREPLRAPYPPSEGVARVRPRNRARRIAWIAGVSLVTLVVLFHLGGGWYFSSLLSERALDGEARREALAPTFDLRVLEVVGGAVTIERPEDPGALVRDGVWGLEWEGGYGQVGSIRSQGPDAVVRDFRHLDGAPPTRGTMAWLDSRAFPMDPLAGIGIAYDDVAYEGQLGRYPAWFVPGARSTWAVLVHGNSMTPRDGLRMLGVTSKLGFPTLVITYRNDPGAPEDPSGMLRYGATEWRDLEAAVRFAFEGGAQDVVLVGFSMGGGIATSFLERSDLAERVRGLVLEAPMLDFSRAVDLNAAREELPGIGLPVPRSLVLTAKWLAGLRFGVDWGATNHLADADRLRVPILLLHGTQDRDVPIETSEDLAAARPDLVTFVRVEGAAHMECWNVDPDGYERTVTSFLERVVPGAA